MRLHALLYFWPLVYVGCASDGSTAPQITGIAATPASLTLHPGQTAAVTLSVEYDGGLVVPVGSSSWTTSDPAVATVDSGGTVAAKGLGNASITGVAEGHSAVVKVSVIPVPIVEIVMSPVALAVGNSVIPTFVVHDSMGAVVSPVGVQLQPVDGSRLAVDGAGRVVALRAGPATVRATIAGFSQVLPMNVDSSRVASISVGDGTYCMQIGSEGRVWCFGGIAGAPGNIAETPQPDGQTSYKSISTSLYASCGIRDDDQAYCWGSHAGTYGVAVPTAGLANFPPSAVPGGIHFKMLEVGLNHACGVDLSLRPYCWSSDTPLPGFGDSLVHPLPTPLATLVPFLSVASSASGGNIGCGLTELHEIYCWGDNSFGALGTSDTTSSRVPRRVSTVVHFNSVSVGFAHVCAVSTEGIAYCWGRNWDGQVGSPSACFYSCSTPTQVETSEKFLSISAGGGTCGLTTAGEVLCWGPNDRGELGTTTAVTNTCSNYYGNSCASLPVKSSLTGTVKSVAINTTSDACAIRTDGALFCWGWNLPGHANAIVPQPISISLP